MKKGQTGLSNRKHFQKRLDMLFYILVLSGFNCYTDACLYCIYQIIKKNKQKLRKYFQKRLDMIFCILVFCRFSLYSKVMCNILSEHNRINRNSTKNHLTLFQPGVVTWYTMRGLIPPSTGRNRVNKARDLQNGTNPNWIF